jgi:ABC-type uncharacterized transport system ATPase subunit
MTVSRLRGFIWDVSVWRSGRREEAVMADQVMIEAEGLVKHFGATVALDGIDLAVMAGSTLGLLGPNGAGKTTAVRILTTLARPDAGRARVAGFDDIEVRPPSLDDVFFELTARRASGGIPSPVAARVHGGGGR